MNFMLCARPESIGDRSCDTWEGCAEKCLTDDCIGWVNDTSENTMFTCKTTDAEGRVGLETGRYESVQKTLFTAWVPGFNNEVV